MVADTPVCNSANPWYVLEMDADVQPAGYVSPIVTSQLRSRMLAGMFGPMASWYLLKLTWRVWPSDES